MGKKKAPSGTWLPRDLFTSPAFWALSSTAKGLLVMFMSKRDMDKQHNVLNRRHITLTYKELENLFGPDAYGNPQGIPRSSIARGIDDLLAKGFVEIVQRGGAYQKDKTVYGLTEEWKFWSKGVVFRAREKAQGVGYQGRSKNLNAQSATHTHRQSEGLYIGDTPSE